MSDVCKTCGGLIMEPNKPYAYAGKVCHCMWQNSPMQKYQGIDFGKESACIVHVPYEQWKSMQEQNALLAAAVVALAGDVATGLELDRIKTGNSGLYSSTLNKYAEAITIAKGLVG